MPKKVIRGGDDSRGGALVEDLSTLAVPFAILLAKRGLESMFLDDKKPKKTGAAKPGKKETKPVKKEAKTKVKKSQKGGDCGCSQPPLMLGGDQSTIDAQQAMESIQQSELASANLPGGAKPKPKAKKASKTKKTSEKKKPVAVKGKKNKKSTVAQLTETIDNFLRDH